MSVSHRSQPSTFCVVKQSLQCIRGEPRHLQPARVHLLQHHQLQQHLGHPHHGVQCQQELSVQQHQISSRSRREKQQIKSRIIIEVIIKEKKVDIIKKNDREVIMQDHPGNSVHIMSDNIKSIYLQRCIIASEFRMDINHHCLFIYMCKTVSPSSSSYS